MAWTTTKNFEFVPATLSLNTGLQRVDHVQLQKVSGAASAASFQEVVKANVGVTSTALAGYVAITGAVSGSEFFLMVIGH